MPAVRLPPTIIMRTVWLAVLASSSANFVMSLSRAEENLPGQWHVSHVSRAGTSLFVSIAEGIGRGYELRTTSNS